MQQWCRSINVVVHSCNPSMGEVEARGLEFKASLAAQHNLKLTVACMHTQARTHTFIYNET